MPALVPAPLMSETDAAAAPFRLTDAARIVAGTGAESTAALAATALGTATGFTPAVVQGVAHDADIVLEVTGHGDAESYTLAAGGDGVRIAGADEAGLFYGVQTLVQLLATSGDAVPATTITDAPRFAYRGMMLDVARHFFPVATVEALIDRASSLKLNALHLHLSDDQGWRVQLRSRPELTERGSGSAVGGDPGGHYAKEDYARIVAYASARHVTIVPEIDGPGHTHAIGLAYPDLMEPVTVTEHVADVADASGGGLPVAGEPYTGMAVGFSSLKTGDEATYDLLADVYGELAAMTPGPYLHVGGDEALSTDPADFATFMDRATRIVADLGKTPIAWHEAGGSAGLAPDTVGQYWGFIVPIEGMDEKARTFARNGARVILSPADAIYLDMKTSADSPLGLVWANGPTSVERSYRWEPTEIIAGLDESAILGIEAPLWTETIRSLDDIDHQAFPRLAAAAETAWSPADGRSWPSFRDRVGALAPLWRRQGIAFHRSTEIDWADA